MEILKYYRSGAWSVTAKYDDSPVTQADLASNEILVRGLERLNIARVVSEEGSQLPANSQELFWLVDPLDGTKDFIAKRDTFVICMGLVSAGAPVFGLVHMPVTGETWWAQAGQGAYGPKDQRLMHPKPHRPLIAAGSRSMDPARLKLKFPEHPIAEVRQMGSALKFCKLAQGEIDLYPRLGPTSEWDTCAGQVIAEEAGCVVLDLGTRARLRYGKQNYVNSDGFLAAREDLE